MRSRGGYLVLFPERQLLLRLLQPLGPVHHEVDEGDAARERQKHQDVGDDPQTDGHHPAGRGSVRTVRWAAMHGHQVATGPVHGPVNLLPCRASALPFTPPPPGSKVLLS